MLMINWKNLKRVSVSAFSFNVNKQFKRLSILNELAALHQIKLNNISIWVNQKEEIVKATIFSYK